MSKIKTLVLILICIITFGCNNKTFTLEDKYYEKSEFIEIDTNKFNELKEDKESFAVFIYQPLCSTSYNFNKVLTSFLEEYKITIYKMSFTDMLETDLKDTIKYYPSFVIYKDGKLIDYLDAGSDDDTEIYKNKEDFYNWFSSYVKLKDKNESGSIDSDNKDNISKIDAVLDNVTYDENKVNIYFFWGDGCPRCEAQFEFLNSIQTEYGDYFNLHTFEVWHNEENEKLLEQFANKMGSELAGVPYTIIGKKTFTGFNETYEKKFLDAIKTQYKDSYDVYFAD